MRLRILLLDAKSNSSIELSAFLERSGFDVTIISSGKEFLFKIEKLSPDLIIMDLLLPDLSGREVLRRLRQSNNWIPVILYTQVLESTERALALEEGADDYLAKSTDLHELIARIHSILRRTNKKNSQTVTANRLVCGELSIDRLAHRVWLGSQELSLTPKALTLLEYFILHPNKLITRDQLLNAVWGWDCSVTTRAVDTRIAELRRVLKCDSSQPTYIETVLGQGYRFLESSSSTDDLRHTAR